jgi:hypothetical protein
MDCSQLQRNGENEAKVISGGGREAIDIFIATPIDQAAHEKATDSE